MDEEMMRPVDVICWIGWVYWVLFSALTLLVGCRKGHPAH